MQVNDNGTVTLPITDLVVLSGIAKQGQNAGKPYLTVKIDGRRGFDYMRNPVSVERLKAFGVRLITKTPETPQV